MLRERLKPPVADAKRIDELIAALDNRNFAVRKNAMDELRRFGELALLQLRQALAGAPTLEARRRMEELVSLATSPTLSGDDARTGRAIEVLERIATTDANQVLRMLADATPQTRRHSPARDALERFGR